MVYSADYKTSGLSNYAQISQICPSELQMNKLILEFQQRDTNNIEVPPSEMVRRSFGIHCLKAT
jgi:hypothetical protein